MDQQKVEMFIITNQRFLPSEKIMYLKERLLALDENRAQILPLIEMKDPNTILLMSIFLGYMGIDRFMIGDIGMGVLKLLTGGLCGILTIIDWFTISNKTKEINFENLMMSL